MVLGSVLLSKFPTSCCSLGPVQNTVLKHGVSDGSADPKFVS